LALDAVINNADSSESTSKVNKDLVAVLKPCAPPHRNERKGEEGDDG
jgi:hypothetical protein